MQRFRVVGAVFMIPVLGFLVIGSGCSGEKKGGGPAADEKTGDTGKKVTKGKTELESNGWGTLSGVALFDGTPPVPADYRETREDFKKHDDHKICEMGDTHDPTWRVNADNKGVQNVVVWIAPPAGKYFKQPPDKTWPDTVLIQQPHCAFEPHVAVAFPGHYDYKSKKQVASGQTFVVNNTAPMKHNTRLQGSPGRNIQQSVTLNSGDEKGHPFNIQPDSEPISLNCDIHKWMTGYVWAFDHPYAVVTDKDGKFELKNVPAGADVDIYYWHESMGKTPKKLKTTKLMPGENKEEIKISDK